MTKTISIMTKHICIDTTAIDTLDKMDADWIFVTG